MSSERLQPLYLDALALPDLPKKWNWRKLEDVALAVPVGRKHDSKSVVAGGLIPVIDQSISGVMGHHNEKPGVDASSTSPVFTFANHTCAIRWMTHPFSCIQNVFAFKGNDGFDTQYLYYASQGRVVLEEYKGHAPVFRTMYVPVPPLSQQRDIADFLALLDDRISLLRETNTTLEAIAQALFKSWFVDFDPVHAKMQGRTPEGMDEATAALFPDSFEDSELGPVPKGWSLSPVYDLATFINGAAYKAFEPNAERRGLPIIKIAELKSGVSATTAFSAVDMPEKYLIEPGDILFSWSGNPDTSIDTFVWPHEPAWLNQHIFRVLTNVPAARAFLLQTLRYLRPVFAELARNKQTTGLGHVTVADLKRLLVVRPDSKALELFNRIIGPVQQRIFENERQALSLSKLRDALLPRLISGQLSIAEAEEALS